MTNRTLVRARQIQVPTRIGRLVTIAACIAGLSLVLQPDFMSDAVASVIYQPVPENAPPLVRPPTALEAALYLLSIFALLRIYRIPAATAAVCAIFTVVSFELLWSAYGMLTLRSWGVT